MGKLLLLDSLLQESQGWSGVLKTGSGQAGCLAGRMSFATGTAQIVFSTQGGTQQKKGSGKSLSIATEVTAQAAGRADMYSRGLR